MANIAGLLSTTNAQASDLVGEWQEEILVRNSKGYNVGSTLFGLMSQLKNEPADNNTFNWWERDPVRLNYYTNGGNLLSTDTTLTFDDSASGAVYQLLSANSILLNDRTGEMIRVTVDPAASAFVVARAQLGTSAAAILDNDLWTLITNAQDEGADPRRAAYEEPTSYANYIQTYDESLFITNAFKNNVLRTDALGPLPERRLQALERITKRIELSYFLGNKGTVSGTNGTIYYTGGIKNAIDVAGLTANALNGNDTTGVALDPFYAWTEAFMTNGSDTKLAFCGTKSYSAINKFASNATAGFRIMNQETVFGLNITNILTPFGELGLCFHPLLKDATAFQDWMFVVDLQLIVQKVMEPLFLEGNIQLPGQASYKEQFRAMLGLKLKFPNAFAYAYNFSKIIPNS